MKEKEFYSQKGTYNRVPLSKKIKAEKLIPIDIFDKFKSKGSYFLESAEVDMKWGRYSIIGLPSESSIKVKNSEIFLNLNGDEEKKSIREFVDNYLLAIDSRALREHIRDTQPDVDLTYDLDGEEEVTIPIGITFFWPDV